MKKIILSILGLIVAGSVMLERSNTLPSGMSIFISIISTFICFGFLIYYNHEQGLKKKAAVDPVKKEAAPAKENPTIGMNVTKELAQKSVPHRGIFAS